MSQPSRPVRESRPVFASDAQSPLAISAPPAESADTLLRGIFAGVKSIAIVGLSANPSRPSWIVARFLAERGYQVWGVNPGLANQNVAGMPVVAHLGELPGPVDMIEIFRNSDAAESIVDEALSLPTLPKVIWMQIGVRSDRAAEKAEARGCAVVMDLCPKIEWERLFGATPPATPL